MGGKLPTQTYHSIYKKSLDFDDFRAKLKLKNIEAKNHLAKKYPHAEKFLKQKGLEIAKIREHSAKLLSTGALTGALLLGFPKDEFLLPSPYEFVDKISSKRNLIALGSGKSEVQLSLKEILLEAFDSILPKKIRPLTRDEEKFLEYVLRKTTNIPVRATLEGEHLNTTFGIIGIEQHLRRYPGDRLEKHGKGDILSAGIANGLGAWGYFAKSEKDLTKDLEDIEKWYASVQTLYLPDWNKRFPYLKDWYKYRKILIVNVENANAVVASVADSGPAAWTGKHFGGSPEVMQALGGDNFKKGKVLVFFVDDPENQISLGPVNYY